MQPKYTTPAKVFPKILSARHLREHAVTVQPPLSVIGTIPTNFLPSDSFDHHPLPIIIQEKREEIDFSAQRYGSGRKTPAFLRKAIENHR